MKLSKEQAEELSRGLVDHGKLIEAGFVGLRTVISPDAPTVQIEEMRMAFFAGAQHLFSSIMTILEPGAEPSDKDLHRMTLINNELREFEEQFKRKYAL